MSLAWLGIWNANAAQSLPSAKFSSNTVGETSPEWMASAGEQDTLLATTDMKVWTPVHGPVSGLGQKETVHIPSADRIVSGGTPSAPPVLRQRYNFIVQKYNPTTIMASWVAVDGTARTAQLDPSAAGVTSSLLTVVNDDTTTPKTAVLVMSYPPMLNAVVPSPITPTRADAVYFSKLTAALPTLLQQSSQPSPPTGFTQAASAPIGPRTMYKVVRNTVDTDGDILTDAQEIFWNSSSAFNPDSNGNGINDLLKDFDSDDYKNYEELAMGMPVTSGHMSLQTQYVLTGPPWEQHQALRFRSLPGVESGYTYQVQKNNDLVHWTDLNHYTNAVGPAFPAGVMGSADSVAAAAASFLNFFYIAYEIYKLDHNFLAVSCCHELLDQRPRSFKDK